MSGSTQQGDYSAAVRTAREYYNSDDADQFYFQIWGGEDIHIGLYQSSDQPIAEASRRTVQAMAELYRTRPTAAHELLDLGAGYGGAARYLAQQFGCHVTALNLSEAENTRHRELNQRAGLLERIEVIDGDFENIPKADASVDFVWSQDAFLHSGQRQRVIAEVVRVLRPGGELVFTDPMAADDCPAGVLDPILQRIHLETLGSPGFYHSCCQQHGLVEVQPFQDQTVQLVNHYSRVLQETERRQEELSASVSPDYIERMKRGLRHWIEGGEAGHLAWGFFHFAKPND